MLFYFATFKIKIRRLHSAFFNFPESFYKDYREFITPSNVPNDFTITIVPYEKFSLSGIKFVRRQNHFYCEQKGTFIIKSRGAIAYLDGLNRKMSLGFKVSSSEKTKTKALMAFVRLAASMCSVLSGGLPFHSSAIAFGNCGIAFSGPSGTGKSTIAKLLMIPGELLNDDLNILLPNHGSEYKIYSTPYAKRKILKKCINRGADLRTIFFIEKSAYNKIENLPFKNKYIFMLAQTFMFPLSDFFGKKILDNAGRLCENVKCKRLHFKNDGAIRPFITRYVGRLK
jgi:hypothetical protein